MKIIVDKIKSKINPRLDKGAEVPDPTPVAIPVGIRKSESMDERIRRIVQHSASVAAASQGLETFDEADDFDIEDDPIDPETPFEQDFDHATVNAIERGIVAPPQAPPRKPREILDKYSKNKPTPSSESKEAPPSKEE